MRFQSAVHFRAIPGIGRARPVPSREASVRRRATFELDSIDIDEAARDGHKDLCLGAAFPDTIQDHEIKAESCSGLGGCACWGKNLSRWSDLVEDPVCLTCAERWGETPETSAQPAELGDFSAEVAKRCEETSDGDDAGRQHQSGSRSGQPGGSTSESDYRNEHAAYRSGIGQPLDSVVRAHSSVCSVSVVNGGTLKSNRGSLHRHLEGSDGDKPAGRVLSDNWHRRRSRIGMNRSCYLFGVSSASWIRRRRSVGCGSKFLGTRASNAHAQSYRRRTHLQPSVHAPSAHTHTFTLRRN